MTTPSQLRRQSRPHRSFNPNRPAETTARKGWLPAMRKFSLAMWQRWLADHNRIQDEKLVGPL